ncbi:MAG: hypothetical protein EBS84_21160 [Proteobacteria bacterium]|nr:hypothetical protein [Pseudomonadota bacterium]
MSINYIYRIQVRQGAGRHWQTKYAVPNRSQAEMLYIGVNIGLGWQNVSTWSDAFSLICIAIAFFCAGRLWGYESQWKEEEQRAARRRAHRHSTKERH